MVVYGITKPETSCKTKRRVQMTLHAAIIVATWVWGTKPRNNAHIQLGVCLVCCSFRSFSRLEPPSLLSTSHLHCGPAVAAAIILSVKFINLKKMEVYILNGIVKFMLHLRCLFLILQMPACHTMPKQSNTPVRIVVVTMWPSSIARLRGAQIQDANWKLRGVCGSHFVH